MRLDAIEVLNAPPVKNFKVEGLSDLVVIAGPNGVGKTRLIMRLIEALRGNTAQVRLGVTPTHESEKAHLADGIPLSDDQWYHKVAGLMQQNRRRRDFKSSVLYYESSRTIQNVQPLAFSFEFADPFEEVVAWDISLNGLGGRWTDTQHAIFKRIQSQRSSIATRAIQLRASGKRSMNLDFDDPLDIFRDAFFQLLGPKTLKRADMSSQRIMYEMDGEEYPIESLSSGEREVVTVCFDFLLRKPSDCVIFFDEPEVHLHPELLSRMVTTLRAVAERNQFIFLSHSPDLISSALEDTVVFLTPPRPDESNQAIIVRAGDETNHVLHALGQSIGVLSLGKKIVVIEGQEASLDKRTYLEILRNRFPQLVLVPAGGRERIDSFQGVVDTLLSRSIWGVSFYLYTDRDSVVAPQAVDSQNLRRLRRYHLENYFLDSATIAKCFESMEPLDSRLRDPGRVAEELGNIASNHVGYVTALSVATQIRRSFGNVSVMPSGANAMGADDLVSAFEQRRQGETERFAQALDAAALEGLVRAEFARFKQMVTDQSQAWTVDFPGKPIVASFCSKAKIPVGRFKTLYINAASGDPNGPFADIISDFQIFADA